MSDYSDDDFETSNGLGTHSNALKNANGRGKSEAAPGASKAKNASPFRAKPAGYSVGSHDEMDYDGYAPGGQAVNSEDAYEDDDFDDEEEEQFKKTAVEFAKKLSALRQSTQYEMVEGGEDPSARPLAEESKQRRAPARPTQQAPLSPPKQGNSRPLRNSSDEITDEALKSPSMLKTMIDRQSKGGAASRIQGNRSPSQDASIMGGGAGGTIGQGGAGASNPFKFIEAALNEAKSKIEKMKNTPQILESLPDEEKKKKFLKAENKLLRENLKRMSDNVNVLIEKMNQESMKKRRAGGGVGAGAQARRANAANLGSNISASMSNQGDVAGEVPLDEHGRPAQGSVGVGLVGGKGAGAALSVAGQSNAGQSVRTGKHQSPHRGPGSINRGNFSVAERELQNTDKAIVNLMKEHNKLKRRLEMIQQPDFLLNLKRDLKTTQEEIKQQEKLKRQLKVDQLRREKKLDSLIEKSEPDVLKQVQDTTQRLAYLTEKLAKLEEENRKAEELRNQQIDQLEELRNRLAKLNTIAEHYGVSVEKSKENMAEHKKLTEQLEQLQKQKRILTQAIDTQTRKQEALTAEKKRDLEQLQMRKGEILAKYNERVVELREKGLQIRDLIDRAKTEADEGLQDILDKWNQANERILEKYPEGSQMSFAQLEEAAKAHLSKQEEAEDGGATKDGAKKVEGKRGSVQKGPGGKKAKPALPQRDDEMQIYLSDIRQKQESLIAKLRADQMAAQQLQEQAIEESVQEVPEESKTESYKGRGGGLKQRRNLKPAKKNGGAQGDDDSRSQAALSQAQSEELIRLKEELAREKAEKEKLAQEIAAQKQREEHQKHTLSKNLRYLHPLSTEEQQLRDIQMRQEEDDDNQYAEGGEEVLTMPAKSAGSQAILRTSQIAATLAQPEPIKPVERKPDPVKASPSQANSAAEFKPQVEEPKMFRPQVQDEPKVFKPEAPKVLQEQPQPLKTIETKQELHQTIEAQPSPKQAQRPVETEAPTRTSQAGSTLGSKPTLGSRPKLSGGGAPFGKPTLGLKAPEGSSIVPQSQSNSIEAAAPEQPRQPSAGSGAQPEPPISVAQSIDGKPSDDAGSATSKPLSFLERARLARGKQQPPSEQKKSTANNSMEELNTIQRENEEAMHRSITRNQDDLERKGTEPMNSIPNSAHSGYQPSSQQQRNLTLLKDGSNTNFDSNTNLPRRRRTNESPKDEANRISVLGSERPRNFNDPFASKPAAVGSMPSSQPQQQVSEPPVVSYEQKMKNEASKGSFLDMIGNRSSNANNKAGLGASRPSDGGSMIMRGSVGSVIAPSQNLASIKPAPKTNMVANLDDLEDLA